MVTPRVLHATGGNESFTTPQFIYDYLNNRFGQYHIDTAASIENALCARFFTEEDDALKRGWNIYGAGTNTWTNPPYTHPKQEKFIHKAYEEAKFGFGNKTLLIPSRTGVVVWQELIFLRARNIIFIRGRIHYSYHGDPAGFDSAIVNFQDSGLLGSPTIETLDLSTLPGYDDYCRRWKLNKSILKEGKV